MARQIIGSIWDRVNRNGINANFEELYADIGLATGTHKTLEEFLNGVGVVGSTMLKTNAVYGDIIRETGIGTRHLLDDTGSKAKIAPGAMNNNTRSELPFKRNIIASNTLLSTVVENGRYVRLSDNSHSDLPSTMANKSFVLDVQTFND